MTVRQFTASGFRCLADLRIEPDSRLNLISGPNASGKTSLLEAIYYLGRGRSFRASANRELIASDAERFQLFGEIVSEDTEHKAGVEVGAGERLVRVDGSNATGADLVRLMPVQAIDPEVHNLIQGGPEFRRQFLDWGVFHVKHSFLAEWRRYRQAQRQRNAALRQKESENSVRAWDAELIAAATAVDEYRKAYFDGYLTLFESIFHEKLPFDVIFSYFRGWSAELDFASALAASWPRDRELGSTQVGPHRADLKLQIQDRRAKHRVSRGQQKLLASALLIAQTQYVSECGLKHLVLLVDDPAAELDRDNRERLFGMLQDVPAQLFITALEPDDLPWLQSGMKYSLDNGELLTLL